MPHCDQTSPPDAARRCAVIYNPTKVSDEFRDQVRDHVPPGWLDPLWLATTADDPGHAMAARARSGGVDLVIAAGGDGTIRAVADGLADTTIPLGVVPAGTGNLLARNLGLPLDQAAALRLAFQRHTRRIDLVEITTDHHASQHFAVMAGIGIDATIMDNVDPTLKKSLGPAAYVIAARKATNQPPMRVTIKVDTQRARQRRASMCLIANVGKLAGGVTLVPDAKPDDALLDVFVVSPRRFTDWVKVFLRVATRRPRHDDTVARRQGRRVEIRSREPEAVQLDGDVDSQVRFIAAEIKPAALTICVAPDIAPDSRLR